MAKAAALARAYLDAVEARDHEAVVALLADDFVLIVPFDTDGTNQGSHRQEGLAMATAFYEAAFQMIVVTTWLDVDITQAEDDTIAFVETVGDMRTADGRPYRNRYVLRIDVADGRIRRIREYLNPVTAALSFGSPLPVTAPQPQE